MMRTTSEALGGFQEEPHLLETMSKTNHAMSVGVASWQIVEHCNPGRQATLDLKGCTIIIRLKLHDAVKFEASCQNHYMPQPIRFQPGTTWDGRHGSGAACGDLGQQAREQIFVLGNEGMNDPETPPLRVLKRPNGKKLH